MTTFMCQANAIATRNFRANLNTQRRIEYLLGNLVILDSAYSVKIATNNLVTQQDQGTGL